MTVFGGLARSHSSRGGSAAELATRGGVRDDASPYRERFDQASPFTVGVEEELMLVDAVSGDLAPAVEQALAAVDGDPRFTTELRAAQIEIVTPVCRTVAEACAEIGSARGLLADRLPGLLSLLAAGTHPCALEPGPLTARDRYLGFAKTYPWGARRALTCGLHIHVAVPGADRALAVYNAMRSYLPEIAALAANSPFYAGEDTGLASARAKLCEAFPRTGVPPAVHSWDELASFVEWGKRSHAFPDESVFWWDMRLHPRYGTIEVRVADAQTRIADTGALAALCQALIADLAERHAAGQALPVHDSYRIAENRWLAIRDGIHAVLADLDTGERVRLGIRIEELLQRISPVAQRLGCLDELNQASDLLDANGAERQRQAATLVGADTLPAWLADETTPVTKVRAPTAPRRPILSREYHPANARG